MSLLYLLQAVCALCFVTNSLSVPFFPSCALTINGDDLSNIQFISENDIQSRSLLTSAHGNFSGISIDTRFGVGGFYIGTASSTVFYFGDTTGLDYIFDTFSGMNGPPKCVAFPIGSNPSFDFYAMTSDSLYKMDLTGATATLIATIPLVPTACEFGSDGLIYMTVETSNTLYAVDLNLGITAPTPHVIGTNQLNTISFNKDYNDILYVGDVLGNIFELNVTNSLVTPVTQATIPPSTQFGFLPEAFCICFVDINLCPTTTTTTTGEPEPPTSQPTTNPIGPPTAEPTTSVVECDVSNSQHTVDWDDELSGTSSVTTDLYSQQTSNSNELFSLEITATADYVLRANYSSLGYDNFGVTYVLDSFQFEDSGRLLQDANYCENRFSDDFSGLSQISSFWTYDLTPNDGIGFPGSNGIGLEYPNSTYDLTLIDSLNPCNGGVKWTTIFNYNELKNNCNFTFVTDDNYLNLTGYFYLTLVSPNPLTYGDGTSSIDVGQYITKQLESEEIIISFPRAYNLINSGTVDLVGSFIISSDFNRDNNVFEVTILTYVPSYLQIVSIDDIISSNNDWSVIEDLDSYDPSSCLVQDDYRCWQKFIISRSISSCSNENVQVLDSDIELLGSFGCSLTSDTTNPLSSCYEFINNINDNQQTNDVSLDSILFSYTEGCDDELYNIDFTGLLTFWNNDFTIEDTIKEYESNGETIYMQVEILDIDNYNVLGIEIESILLCTADVLNINLFTSCLDTAIVDNSLFYNLITDPNYQITNILDNSPDTTDNIEQFSFPMPPIADDVFFVDVTVKLTLNTGTRRLRNLLQNDNYNRFTNAFVGATIIQQATDPNNSNNSNNKNNKNNLMWIVIVLSIILFLFILGFSYLIFRNKKLSKEMSNSNAMNELMKIKSISQSNTGKNTPTVTATSTPTIGSTNAKQHFAITTFEPNPVTV